MGADPPTMNKEDIELIDSYINASYINGLISNFSEKSTIACCAPNEATLYKFWSMVYQNKAPMICQLCPLRNEHGNEECINYLMELENEGQEAYISSDCV